MTTTPCVGNAEVYDAVLFDDVTDEQRAHAVHQTASLCNDCHIAATCGERVTETTAPREVPLLPEGWLPAAREGVRMPEEPPARRRSADWRAGQAMNVGRDYVRPEQRPVAWARMAAELAASGQIVPEIALGLCVSADTVEELLSMAHAAG